MGKRIYNFDEFVNESYTNEGFFSDLGAKVSSWAKNLYNAVKSGIISLISYLEQLYLMIQKVNPS